MTRVFIYGGCVSRDAVRYYPTYGMRLVGYISRQSLPSAFAPAKLSDFRIPTGVPKFQQRMIRDDIRSSLPRTIEEKSQEIDMVIWDLNIERVGFSQLQTGGVATSNGVQPVSKSPITTYKFGTADHFKAWEAALGNFVGLLEDLDLLNRTYVNATPWARQANIPASDALWKPDDFNTLISQYWDRAEQAGITVVRVPSSKAVADPQHKWGPAYFHYQPQAYKAQVRLIAESAGLKRKTKILSRQVLSNIFSRHV